MSLSGELRSALTEALGRDDIAVRWRKGSHVTIWIFRIVTTPTKGTRLALIGYGLGYRNWRRDPLHRDVFTAVQIHAASKGYVRVIFDLMQEIVYPVMFKRLSGSEGKKKVSKSPTGLYADAMTLKKFNRTAGRKYGVELEPEKKPVAAIDKTHRQVVEK